MSNQIIVYSFIMDWNGGTYVSQFSGKNIKNTIALWAKSIDIELLKIQPRDKINFIIDVLSENPVKLKNTTGIWVISPNINGKIAIVNIVQTSI